MRRLTATRLTTVITRLKIYTIRVYHLDADLYYLGANTTVFDAVLTRTSVGKAALLFTDPDLAAHHLSALPDGFQVTKIDATDLRAKEELLRSVIARGAAELYINPRTNSQTPAIKQLSQQALNYILSFKNQAACL